MGCSGDGPKRPKFTFHFDPSQIKFDPSAFEKGMFDDIHNFGWTKEPKDRTPDYEKASSAQYRTEQLHLVQMTSAVEELILRVRGRRINITIDANDPRHLNMLGRAYDIAVGRDVAPWDGGYAKLCDFQKGEACCGCGKRCMKDQMRCRECGEYSCICGVKKKSTVEFGGETYYVDWGLRSGDVFSEEALRSFREQIRSMYGGT